MPAMTPRLASIVIVRNANSSQSVGMSGFRGVLAVEAHLNAPTTVGSYRPNVAAGRQAVGAFTRPALSLLAATELQLRLYSA